MSQVMLVVFRAHHPSCSSGHWVVMKANISGVDLYIMVYVWSQQQHCLVVSTCGKMVTHKIKYRSKYANQFDNTEFNKLSRPAVLYQLFNFLPLIDKANKERQNALALEKKIFTSSQRIAATGSSRP